MREYEDMPYIVIERRSGGATPFLWGVLLGAGVALLMAPRSGPETQEEIRARARRLREAAEGRVHDARDSVTGAVTRTRNRIYDRVDSVREVIDTRTRQAREALDAGRRAALDARAELERRVAQAKGEYQLEVDGLEEAVSAPTRATRAVDVVITDVVVEEADGQPDLS